MSSPGTTTPFKDVYDSLSISMGDHNLKIGGAYSNYKTHEYASPNPLGTWTFSVDQYFNPSDLNNDGSSTNDLVPGTSGAWAIATTRRCFRQ